jgi:hypothetical protein
VIDKDDFEVAEVLSLQARDGGTKGRDRISRRHPDGDRGRVHTKERVPTKKPRLVTGAF